MFEKEMNVNPTILTELIQEPSFLKIAVSGCPIQNEHTTEKPLVPPLKLKGE